MTDADRATDDAGRPTRRDLPVRVRTLTEEGSGADVMPGTAAERLDAVEELTRTAWELSGRAFPDYRRENTPVRVVSRDAPSSTST